MAAQLENVPVSIAFLVVLIITTTELSIASPGDSGPDPALPA